VLLAFGCKDMAREPSKPAAASARTQDSQTRDGQTQGNALAANVARLNQAVPSAAPSAAPAPKTQPTPS
jgi:hypothetical protein